MVSNESYLSVGPILYGGGVLLLWCVVNAQCSFIHVRRKMFAAVSSYAVEMVKTKRNQQSFPEACRAHGAGRQENWIRAEETLLSVLFVYERRFYELS